MENYVIQVNYPTNHDIYLFISLSLYFILGYVCIEGWVALYQGWITAHWSSVIQPTLEAFLHNQSISTINHSLQVSKVIQTILTNT